MIDSNILFIFNSNDISSLATKMLLNERQALCLKDCKQHLIQALEQDDNLLKVEHLKNAVKSLKKIRGEYNNIEDIYDRVFAKFCIGK